MVASSGGGYRLSGNLQMVAGPRRSALALELTPVSGSHCFIYISVNGHSVEGAGGGGSGSCCVVSLLLDYNVGAVGAQGVGGQVSEFLVSGFLIRPK